MGKKRLVVFLLAISLCLSVFAFAEIKKEKTEKEKAEEEFQALKTDFQNEISQPPYSDYNFTDRYWDSESGRNIIAMGKRALPFIMEEIKNREYSYIYAAQRITGIKMWGMTNEEVSANWLDWWQDNYNNPQWNVYGKEPAGN